MKNPEQAKAMIMELLEADKAEDIVLIELAGKTTIADYMLVATGRSSRHVSAMAEHVSELMKPCVPSVHIEGQATGDWVLVDTGDIIVHLFRPEVRDFYKIEKIWQEPESWIAKSASKAKSQQMESIA